MGVELAGEFKTDFPDKQVTLVSNSNRLVSVMSESFSAKSLDVLTRRRVNVILNDKIDLSSVENFKPNKLKSENGKEIEFDAYFICIGSKPCTDLLKSCMPACLNESGYIKGKCSLIFLKVLKQFSRTVKSTLNAVDLSYKEI